MLLVALALAVRVAVPTGFMPTATDSGIVVSICTGQGSVLRTISVGSPKHEAPAERTTDHCTYASVAGSALHLPTIYDLALPVLPQTAWLIGTAIADLTVHRLAAPPPPSHGPPLSA